MRNLLIYYGWLFFFICGFLQAGAFDHLRKIENKTTGHSIRNIDFIYMINLDHRPEKYERSCQQLIKYNIKPLRFSAINGWELPLEVINDVGVKYQIGMDPVKAIYFNSQDKIPKEEDMTEVGKSYLGFKSLGALGSCLSYLSVLQDAYDSGYETIWVMQDDIEILQNPHKLSELIDKLDDQVGKDNWDVLFTDREYRNSLGQLIIARGRNPHPLMKNTLLERYRKEYCYDEKISEDFRRIGARFGAHSMIIRRSGIIKLLNHRKTNPIFLVNDVDNYLPLDIHRYTVLEDVVANQLSALSDI